MKKIKRWLESVIFTVFAFILAGLFFAFFIFCSFIGWLTERERIKDRKKASYAPVI